ncbi:uncharacterized protein LOC119726193 isoform X2 [Patiria miniata]|nr:uncharacterized protein LOC119726193 isoform X2 [Patiria miniata]
MYFHVQADWSIAEMNAEIGESHTYLYTSQTDEQEAMARMQHMRFALELSSIEGTICGNRTHSGLANGPMIAVIAVTAA